MTPSVPPTGGWGELLSGIEQMPYAAQVYVVVVSDHGMASVDRQVVLSDIVDLRGVRSVPLGPGDEPTPERETTPGAPRYETRSIPASAPPDARAFLRHEAPEHPACGERPPIRRCDPDPSRGRDARVPPRRVAATRNARMGSNAAIDARDLSGARSENQGWAETRAIRSDSHLPRFWRTSSIWCRTRR